MATPTSNGILNQEAGLVTSPNTGTWEDLGSGSNSAGASTFANWDEWTSWNFIPNATLTWVSETVDLGDNYDFNITWEWEGSGTPTFQVYCSQTGAYAGEETIKTIIPGQEDIEAFYGRFVFVFMSVAQDGPTGAPQITKFEWKATNALQYEQKQFDVVSSNLTGSASARAISMPRAVSKVLSMLATAQSDNYVADDYVASSYIEAGVPGFPTLISKTRTGPEITFVNSAGTRVDATFDITLTVLPEQFMNGNNLSVR